MPLMQPYGGADDAGKYRNRFSGFWKVFETILLSMMDRVKSRKLTAVVGSSISHVKIPKLFTVGAEGLPVQAVSHPYSKDVIDEASKVEKTIAVIWDEAMYLMVCKVKGGPHHCR